MKTENEKARHDKQGGQRFGHENRQRYDEKSSEAKNMTFVDIFHE